MRRSSSLRNRLTAQTISAIVILVVVLAVVTLASVSIHLFDAAQSDAYAVYDGVSQVHGATQRALLQEYTRALDPHIWVIQHHHVIAHSPNTTARLPSVSHWGPVVFQPVAAVQIRMVSGSRQYLIAWPISSDLDVLGDLLLVLGIVTATAALVGVLLGRWITGRVLEPVKDMTESVQAMIRDREYHPVINPSPETGDEFSQLSHVFSQLITILNDRWERDRTLLAEAAHQLRTPLEVIRGNLDILSHWESLDTVLEDESLAAMDRAVGDMTHLVRDLLTLEQANRQLPTKLQPLQLVPVLEDIVEDAHALRPDLHIVFTPPPSTPSRVLGFEPYTRRALWSILENALKYAATPESPVEIDIVASEEHIDLVVKDHGPGIPEADLPHLFERFYRGETSRGTVGTGLGLSIAHALMTAQRGALEVESSESGTRVHLRFVRAV